MDTATPTRSCARRRRALAGVLVVTLGAGLVLASCSGGGGGDDQGAKTTTSVAKNTTLDIHLGDVSADSAGAPVTIADDQSQHVLDALTTYVKGGIVEPLRSGKPATADFGAIFDATTLASATSTDRGVLFDEGLPRVTGDLTVVAQPVKLVGLGDQSGNLTLITAAVALDAKGATDAKDAPVHVVRIADFTLQPDATTGAWKITAYNVAVTREGTELPPTASSGAATTGAAQ
jgi:hypothetical protein